MEITRGVDDIKVVLRIELIYLYIDINLELIYKNFNLLLSGKAKSYQNQMGKRFDNPHIAN